jgi:hypothetical protein
MADTTSHEAQARPEPPEPPEPRADEGNGADAALDDSLVDGAEAPPDGIEQEVLLDLAGED